MLCAKNLEFYDLEGFEKDERGKAMGPDGIPLRCGDALETER